MGYIFGLAALVWFIYAAFFTSMFTPELVAVCLYVTGYVVAMAVLFSSAMEKP